MSTGPAWRMSTKLKEGAKPASGAVKVTAKKHRWYLGGIASAMAAACTHPLDLLKVGMQSVVLCTVHCFKGSPIHILAPSFMVRLN